MTTKIASHSTTFEKIFGDFGKNIKYNIQLVFNEDYILLKGLDNIGFTVIYAGINQDDLPNLIKYHIDTEAWAKAMIKHYQEQDNFQNLVLELFQDLPEEFKEEYRKKHGNEIDKIKKMKVIKDLYDYNRITREINN